MENNKKLEKGAIVTFIIAFLTFVLAANFPDAAQAYFLYEIATQSALTAEQMTLLASAGVIGVTCTCLFAGILMDKFSPRNIMAVSVAIAGVGVIGRGLMHGFGGVFAAFLLTGLMFGVYWYGVNKIITLWFPKKYLLIANSIMTSGGSIGWFLALNTSGVISEAVGGWQNYFKVLGAAMIVLGVLWIIFVPDRKSEEAVMNRDVSIVESDKTSIIDNLRVIIKSPKVWCCIISMTGFGNYVALVSGYTTTVLQMSSLWALDADGAAGVQSFGNVGSLLGYYIIPFLLMKLYKGKTTAGICTIAQFVSVVLCLVGLLSGNPQIYTILFVVCGFCNGLGFSAPITYMCEQPEVAGLRSGTAIGLFTLISQGLQIIGMVTIGYAFGAMSGAEHMAFAYYLAIYGFVGVLAMGTLHYLNKRDERKA